MKNRSLAIKRRWINLSLEKEQHSTDLHSDSSPVRSSAESTDRMSIALRMVELRAPTVVMGLFFILMILSLADHLCRTTWTYFSVALLATAIPVVFLLMGSYRISVNDEKIRIQDSFFIGKDFPKDNITKVTAANNSMYKYRIPYIGILCLLILLVVLMQIYGEYRAISTYGLQNATNIGLPFFTILLFIILLYRTYQTSRYHTTIKIDTTDRKITLYPENEEKYQLLKGKLDTLTLR